MHSTKDTYKILRAIIIILVIYSVLLIMDYSNFSMHTGTLCVFKNITGVPCPGCGLGRATVAIFKGSFLESFHYNIIAIPFTLAVFISFIWLLTDLIRKRNSFFETINRKLPFVYLIPFFVLTAISWLVNIIRGI